ncbi:MAG: helix-turn-helix transcriptional regulator [Paraclostridium bifermentans]|uniref:winged helix-turn-helix transcriptional regulator n=1 Tax=Paraclostridium bifermentans TaxID=1490 RepID=UPI0011DD7541|nr:helix-turn-helix domain-containing protein [Paraclostridium bifermentans]MBS6509864.1 helix-turn-helix transcriptional regulator [Paraclostridium bifermentans]MDU3804288.1 helix-turn-helix domain-containing protein [Paraclostridium bifermentans]
MIKEYDIENIESCPVSNVQKIVSGKWTMVIVYYLSQSKLRFGEIHKKIPSITQATLSKQLQTLEEYGLINRKVYNQIPPKVEYSLTDIGEKFVPVLESLENWAIEYESYRNNK